MSEFQHKRSESKERSAVPAVIKARDMLCDLALADGGRIFNDSVSEDVAEYLNALVHVGFALHGGPHMGDEFPRHWRITEAGRRGYLVYRHLDVRGHHVP